MTFSTLLAFLGAAIILTLMPGPDNLFVLAQSITQDKKAGIATSLGLCTGLLVHIGAAVLGISAIIYQSTVIFSIVKFAGAAYLLYLAWQSFRAKGDPFTLGQHNEQAYVMLYRKGILMNILNPKVSLFFLALLPQFVNPSNGHVSLQMFILGSVFLVQALILFSLFSIFAGKVRRVIIGKPAIAKRLNMIQGVLFTFIGIQIALSKQ
ncbi:MULTISPECIES: LysE family translocator [unclassified Lysinibacillus]|uniref:LysE family translocator n=1 Tax=unclassified Lysinibacillus TaxID=2636778 RepID=UPI0020137AF8|nr:MULTISPECIES: LysE family translocator [unclassified Lysinibacillus]MCL1694369.1 LysE family translocator [Lysinibacillus sp. BPa_S21]MCL1699202.1 LysE family translocator [Lysinibacillus sp. Bpr_S20]